MSLLIHMWKSPDDRNLNSMFWSSEKEDPVPDPDSDLGPESGSGPDLDSYFYVDAHVNR